MVNLLEKRISERGWSDNARQVLFRLALKDPDPELNRLNVYDLKRSNLASEASPNMLASNAINCVRGIAYSGVSHLMWDDEQFALNNKHLIQAAIDDYHPAVNFSALVMLLPMLNYDEEYALNSFLSLSKKDLRISVARGSHYFFNNGFYTKYRTQFVELVLCMKESLHEEVRKESARQIFARWFFDDLFVEQFKELLSGNKDCREGVTSILNQLLSDGKYQDKLHKLIPVYKELVNDEQEDVRSKITRCISSDKFLDNIIACELLTILVSSKAAFKCLYELFSLFENIPGSILIYRNQLMLLIENITSSRNFESARKDFHIKETSLISRPLKTR